MGMKSGAGQWGSLVNWETPRSQEELDDGGEEKEEDEEDEEEEEKAEVALVGGRE